MRFDLQPCGQIGEQVDEWTDIAVKGPAGDQERLEVVVARRQRLHRGPGTDASRNRGDAVRDLHVVLARSTGLGEYSTEEGQQLLEVVREGCEVGTDVQVCDAIRGQWEELHGRVADPDLATLHFIEEPRHVRE